MSWWVSAPQDGFTAIASMPPSKRPKPTRTICIQTGAQVKKKKQRVRATKQPKAPKPHKQAVSRKARDLYPDKPKDVCVTCPRTLTASEVDHKMRRCRRCRCQQAKCQLSQYCRCGSYLSKSRRTSERMECRKCERARMPAPEPKPKPEKWRGFASMPMDRIKEIARAGGKASVKSAGAYKFTSENARAAALKRWEMSV